MTKPSIKVVAMKKTKNPKKDKVVGEFVPRTFVHDKYDLIVNRANKLYGKNGWDVLQIWETRVVCLDIISK